MLSFLSIEFGLVFLVFLALYWSARRWITIQNCLLIAFGFAMVVGMAGLMPAVALLTTSVFICSVIHAIDKSVAHKKHFMWLGVVAVLSQLAFFKYYNFFYETLSQNLAGFDSSGAFASLIFPLGLSYYSFKAISTLVAQVKNNTPAPKFLDLLTYLSFFATVTSGPITRLHSAKGLNAIDGTDAAMLPQIRPNRLRELYLPATAFLLIILALTKKWWLASYLADNWVNPVFSNPSQYHSLEILVAIYGYTLQLFLDFSGYSELMIAFGLLLGFRLPVNFNAPLLAHNIRDFWDRWHISLSTWIRDYIYIPLGGSRGGFAKTQLNLLLAMLFSGIWHGNSINFFLWGFLHGLALVLLNIGDFLLGKLDKNSPKPKRDALAKTGIFGKMIGVFITVHFVCFAFVFFRIKEYKDALAVFEALAYNHTNIAWTTNPLFLLVILAVAWLVYPIGYALYLKTIVIKNKVVQYALILPLLILFIAIVILAPSGIPGFIYANF